MKLYTRVITKTITLREYYEAERYQQIDYQVRDGNVKHVVQEGKEKVEVIESITQVPNKFLGTLESSIGYVAGYFEREPEAAVVVPDLIPN